VQEFSYYFNDKRCMTVLQAISIDDALIESLLEKKNFTKSKIRRILGVTCARAAADGRERASCCLVAVQRGPGRDGSAVGRGWVRGFSDAG
jgi:hypothetical protein